MYIKASNKKVIESLFFISCTQEISLFFQKSIYTHKHIQNKHIVCTMYIPYELLIYMLLKRNELNIIKLNLKALNLL